jgi:hypothetical protein
MLAAPVAAAPAGKVFVCKYVITPGGEERLQEGGNPIDVSVNAINAFKDFHGDINDLVGESFADGQGRSYVLAVDVGQPDPDPSECPPPNPPGTPSVLAVQCTSPTDAPRLRVLGLLAGLHLFIDGTEVQLDVNSEVVVSAGTHAWSVKDGEGTVLFSGEITLSPCPTSSTPTPEGSELGGTGTPAPSLQNTALSALGFGGPLATLVFGAILLSSLGALAYANVRATRSRR